MMVQIRPRLSLGLPSTISWAPIFSSCTRWSFKNWSALSTFSKQWIRILPLVGRSYKNKILWSSEVTHSKIGCNIGFIRKEVLQGRTRNSPVFPRRAPLVILLASFRLSCRRRDRQFGIPRALNANLPIFERSFSEHFHVRLLTKEYYAFH